MRSKRDAGQKTVLVAASQDIVRRFLIRALAREGYAARGARFGREALAMLARDADEIALLVTDLGLPDMGGGGCSRLAQDAAPRLRVLFMTGGGRRGLAGPGRVLAKPFTHGVFLAAVARALSEL